MLESGGIDHRGTPYVDRLLTGLNLYQFSAIQPVYTAQAAREKTGLYARLRQQFKEGIVLKLLTAGYAPGKTSGSTVALKYKFIESASFVVTLVHPTKRSVSLRLYSGSDIVEAGNVTISLNHKIPNPGTVVEVRYLYAFRQSGAVYQPLYLGIWRRRNADACWCPDARHNANPRR